MFSFTNEGKMTQTSTLRFVLAVVSAGSLFAQPRTLQLIIAEAQKPAIQNNPRLAAAKFNASAAYQVPAEYRSNFGPTVTGNLTGVGADSASRLAEVELNNPVV